jgi:lipoprotein-anchoring transpeptidase ErfK/SrfK
VKRGLLAAICTLGLAAVACPGVLAAKPAPAKAKPKAPPKPYVLPAGVRVAGVRVGHLTPAAATRAVEQAFAKPLTVVVNGRQLTLRPTRLARAYVEGAIGKARTATHGTNIPLVVAVQGTAVRAAVANLARQVDHSARQGLIQLKNLRPYVAPGAYGRKLDQEQLVQKVVHELTANVRLPMRASTRVVQPRMLADGFAPLIVINREANVLTLFKGTKLWRQFHVATGQDAYPTPRGNFHIVVKWVNPTWYPPTQDAWAAGLSPVPPGPDNPLGTRWMGLSYPGVGIHGTDEPSSIGQSLSHGCIRMQVPDSEWLFAHVQVGTPVYIR